MVEITRAGVGDRDRDESGNLQHTTRPRKVSVSQRKRESKTPGDELSSISLPCPGQRVLTKNIQSDEIQLLRHGCLM
jgi:hypothetical protein